MKFRDIHVAIISHKRPDNVKLMEEITKLDHQLQWYVGEGEGDDYKHAYGSVHEGGDLCHSRNLALDDAFEKDRYCLMLDDDLIKCQLINPNKTAYITSFEALVEEMYDTLLSVPLYLAGVAPTLNPFFYNPEKPLGLKHFIGGWCTLTKPTPLRFDINLRTKEDYDITLQHVRKYGGVCRLNYAIPAFKHLNNEGGVVDYRTDAVEDASIKYLKQKWGSVIRDNVKRPHEILLKL